MVATTARRWDPRRWRRSALHVAVLGVALGAARAGAVTVDFDALPDLSDVAEATLPGVSVSPALVASETSLADLTGFDTDGWATSGSQGLLNLYGGGTITIGFATPVSAFSIDVLPFLDGAEALTPLAGAISATAYDGDEVVATFTSGAAFEPVSFAHASSVVTRLVISGPGPDSFFADTLTFTPIPEPGAATLALAGLAALAAVRRSR